MGGVRPELLAQKARPAGQLPLPSPVSFPFLHLKLRLSIQVRKTQPEHSPSGTCAILEAWPDGLGLCG